MLNNFWRFLTGGIAVAVSLLAGSWLSALLPVKLPAAILGLLVLLAFLGIVGRVPQALQLTTRPLLIHMPLFFVPAVIAVWQFTDVIVANSLTLFMAIVVTSLVLIMALAIWVDVLLKDKHEH